jgi:plastocyanin
MRPIASSAPVRFPGITRAHDIQSWVRASRASRLIPAALTVLAIFAAAGCGEDEGSAGRTVTTAAGEPVDVIGTEYAFDPSTVIVEGGGPIEIRLDNQGALAHNLTLFDGDSEVGGTPTFQGGESETAEVDLEPGAYEMICTVGDHEALGMVGELEVR